MLNPIYSVDPIYVCHSARCHSVNSGVDDLVRLYTKNILSVTTPETTSDRMNTS